MQTYPELEAFTESKIHENYQEKIVQFFFLLNRKENDEEIAKIATILDDLLCSLKGFKNNETFLILLYKMIAHTRDIVYGKGERKLTYMMISVWYKHYPVFAIYALYRLFDLLSLPEKGLPLDIYLNSYLSSRKHSFGCWKDIKYFCWYIAEHSAKKKDDPLIEIAITIMNDQLERDLTVVNTCMKSPEYSYYDGKYQMRKYISYVAKWVPRENTKFDWVFDKLALDWAHRTTPYYFAGGVGSLSLSNKYKMNYRKIVSGLNRILDTVEVKQCSRMWSVICPENITAGSLAKYKNAFMNINRGLEERKATTFNGDRRICSYRFKVYYKDLFHPQEVDTTTSLKNYGLGHFVKTAHTLFGDSGDNEIIQNRLYLTDLLNKEVKKYIDSFDTIVGAIPFLDCCGDVNIYEALELTYIISTKSSGKCMMVGHSSDWCELNQDDFIQNIEKMWRVKHTDSNISMSNILDSMDIFIQSLVTSEMSNENIAKMVLVIITNKEYADIDLYNKIISKFTTVLPHIIFWNISAKTFECFPSNERKITMISGMNVSLLRDFKYMNLGFTSFEAISHILNNQRFRVMEDYMRSYLD